MTKKTKIFIGVGVAGLLAGITAGIYLRQTYLVQANFDYVCAIDTEIIDGKCESLSCTDWNRASTSKRTDSGLPWPPQTQRCDGVKIIEKQVLRYSTTRSDECTQNLGDLDDRSDFKSRVNGGRVELYESDNIGGALRETIDLGQAQKITIRDMKDDTKTQQQNFIPETYSICTVFLEDYKKPESQLSTQNVPISCTDCEE